jgi:hypothetical protein
VPYYAAEEYRAFAGCDPADLERRSSLANDVKTLICVNNANIKTETADTWSLQNEMRAMRADAEVSRRSFDNSF